jgi:CheY-like chemotaxis protein
MSILIEGQSPEATVSGSEESTLDLRETKSIFFPKILLIDDDVSFTKIISKAAGRKHLSVVECTSIRQVGKLPFWNFDIALIDYDLGDITGVQLTDIVSHLREIPVLLLSQYRQITMRGWPDCIKGFLHKSAGPFAILQAAIDTHRTSVLNLTGGK